MMKNNFKIISFDADDTLWLNESYYRETEDLFCTLLTDYDEKEVISSKLFSTEVSNLELYGYGAKGFTLSMIQAALELSDNKVSQAIIDKIVTLGKELIDKPLVLLEGVEETLDYISGKNLKLIVATKGDLLDQERKLMNSGLGKYFHHIEIMSDKKEANYQKLLSGLNITPEDFLMVGNSLKSDILPVLAIGGYGIHVPYHTTWLHEVVNGSERSVSSEKQSYIEIQKISEIRDYF